jgi:hypothetical protein
MKNLIRLFTLLAVLFCLGNSNLGFSVFQKATAGSFSCFAQMQGSFIMIQGENVNGALNDYAVDNLKYSRMANRLTHVYIFACPTKEPAKQISNILDQLPTNLYNTV